LSPTLALNPKTTKASLRTRCTLVVLFHFFHLCIFVCSKWLLKNVSILALLAYYDIPNNQMLLSFPTLLALHARSTHLNIPFCLSITSQIIGNNVIYTIIYYFLDVLGIRMVAIMASLYNDLHIQGSLCGHVIMNSRIILPFIISPNPLFQSYCK